MLPRYSDGVRRCGRGSLLGLGGKYMALVVNFLEENHRPWAVPVYYMSRPKQAK
jgi:hypothetical protein